MREESWKRNLKLFFVLTFALVWTSSATFAQEENTNLTNEPAPPPLVALSGEEKSQLSAETDFKRRTQLALQLADARLQRAEQFTVGDDYQGALSELGIYQAIINDNLKFLQRNNDDSRRIRDNFKRMEITLRTHASRLETIRRATPFEFASHLKSIMTFARDARTRALNSFFSDTVLEGETAGVQLINSTSNSEKKP